MMMCEKDVNTFFTTWLLLQLIQAKNWQTGRNKLLCISFHFLQIPSPSEGLSLLWCVVVTRRNTSVFFLFILLPCFITGMSNYNQNKIKSIYSTNTFIPDICTSFLKATSSLPSCTVFSEVCTNFLKMTESKKGMELDKHLIYILIEVLEIPFKQIHFQLHHHHHCNSRSFLNLINPQSAAAEEKKTTSITHFYIIYTYFLNQQKKEHFTKLQAYDDDEQRHPLFHHQQTNNWLDVFSALACAAALR